MDQRSQVALRFSWRVCTSVYSVGIYCHICVFEGSPSLSLFVRGGAVSFRDVSTKGVTEMEMKEVSTMMPGVLFGLF